MPNKINYSDLKINSGSMWSLTTGIRLKKSRIIQEGWASLHIWPNCKNLHFEPLHKKMSKFPPHLSHIFDNISVYYMVQSEDENIDFDPPLTIEGKVDFVQVQLWCPSPAILYRSLSNITIIMTITDRSPALLSSLQNRARRATSHA